MIISPPMFRFLLAMVATFTICTMARGDGVHTFASADDTNFTNDGSGTPSMQTSTAQDTGAEAGASSASAAISDTINSVLEGHSLSEGISKDNGFSADGSADASTSGGISYVIHYHGTNPLPRALVSTGDSSGDWIHGSSHAHLPARRTAALRSFK